MLFSWLKHRRRRKILAEPFPQSWVDYLDNNVAHYRLLSETERAKLRDDLRIFIAERQWEGCGGLQLTDEIKVTIAAQACLLILGLDLDLYRRIQTILVYPSGYRGPHHEVLGDNMVLEGEAERLGEAHYRGPLVLSWQEVLRGSRDPAARDNVVIHEFAHQLDMLNGMIDGTPPLGTRKQARRWQQVMTAEFRRLRRDADAGRATLLDPYGTVDEGEFFAVASECFFDLPIPLRQEHPRLYDLLRDFYNQDPAARTPTT
jgi:Mlc titration factor MtfA (ptsG expression regulator)